MKRQKRDEKTVVWSRPVFFSRTIELKKFEIRDGMKEKCILRDIGFRGFIPSRSEFVSVEIWTNKRDETGMKLTHHMSQRGGGVWVGLGNF
jgi:hypothetical protein